MNSQKFGAVFADVFYIGCSKGYGNENIENRYRPLLCFVRAILLIAEIYVVNE